MSLNRKEYKTKLDGEEIKLEVSDMAKQADGAVLGRYGDTVVLATACMDDEAGDLPFFPLTVDYEEKFYAVGEILGSRFLRREGRPSETATLNARLIDRTIRPLFDQRLRRSLQIVITVISYDGEHDLETISLLATSAALSISSIPWDGPVAGVMNKLGEDEDGEEFDAFFAGPKGKVNMIEAGTNEMTEDKAIELFEESQKKIDKLVDFQKEIIDDVGKEKQDIEFTEANDEVKNKADDVIEKELDQAIEDEDLESLEKSFVEKLEEDDVEEDQIQAGKLYLKKKMKAAIADMAINDEKRVDGRGINDVRELYSEVDLFERLHGTGYFQRGDTHMLGVTTLAPPSAKKLIDSMEKQDSSKRFMLHYNFPSFSVGEAGRARGPGRREIGHGALARKALKPFIPSKEELPYTIRIVAETMSSNGSTSQAAICAGSLSLMDAGVNLKGHVAGIAMGLMVNDEEDWQILTDIQGPEDHYGVMDLKVAGSRDGINAMQMDVKIQGITLEMFKEALPRAKQARMDIIDVMEDAISSPSEEFSKFAPTILNEQIDEDKIGMVIGPGGKTINRILEVVGEDEVSIDIEDDGNIYVSGSNRQKAEQAMKMVKEVIREYEVGEVIEGEVVKILDFGAIVEFGTGKSGMIHVSELADDYVDNVEDVVEEGDTVQAKIIGKEDNGNIKLSIKQLDK